MGGGPPGAARCREPRAAGAAGLCGMRKRKSAGSPRPALWLGGHGATELCGEPECAAFRAPFCTAALRPQLRVSPYVRTYFSYDFS